MKRGSIRTFAYVTVSVIGGGLAIFLFFKYIFLLVLPFLIAWGIAFSTRPMAAALQKKIKLPAPFLRTVLAILISITALGVIFFAIWGLIAELWNFLSGIGEGDAIRELIDSITSGGFFGGVFDSFGNAVGEVFYNFIISIATALGTMVTSWVSAVPKVVLFLVVTVISTVYFALELELVNEMLSRILPKGVYQWLAKFKRGFFSVGLKYVRSYLFLMLITFAVILVGLVILVRPYALLLAFVIAVLDLLPVIGVGTVLVPWSVYEILLGDRGIGIGLLILFVVHTLIRQFAEPKIVGKNLGVHPIITLALIYIGYSLFGFIGILFVPIATVLIDITLGKENTTEVDKPAGPERDGT